jgi:nuclear pore complex protein Nup155
MLLGLASGNTFLDAGEQSCSGALCSISPDIPNVAKQAFYNFGERPIWTERVTYGTSEYCFPVRLERELK